MKLMDEVAGYNHDHDWDWNKNPPRQPAREPNKLLAVMGLIGTGVVIVWLIGNDTTGFGVVDDVLIPAVASSFLTFWIILFNKGENTIW